MKAAIIKDNKVINTVELPEGWTGLKDDEWKQPEGTILVLDKEASTDDDFDGVKIDKSKRGPKPDKPSPDKLEFVAKTNALLQAPTTSPELKEFIQALMKRVN